MIPATRNRPYLIVAVLCTIALGLASRAFPQVVPEALGKYPGDALWAQMVYWLVGFLVPTASVARVAAWSIGISYTVEISQLCQAPWINEVRATTLGHLVLGSHFSWPDLLAYTVGIGLVAPFEWLVLRARARPARASARAP